MERRLGIMQSVEPVLENAIKTLQKVVDVRGMGKKASLIQLGETPVFVQLWEQGEPEKKEEEKKEEKKAAPKKKCEWKPPAMEKVEKEAAGGKPAE